MLVSVVLFSIWARVQGDGPAGTCGGGGVKVKSTVSGQVISGFGQMVIYRSLAAGSLWDILDTPGAFHTSRLEKQTNGVKVLKI